MIHKWCNAITLHRYSRFYEIVSACWWVPARCRVGQPHKRELGVEVDGKNKTHRQINVCLLSHVTCHMSHFHLPSQATESGRENTEKSVLSPANEPKRLKIIHVAICYDNCFSQNSAVSILRIQLLWESLYSSALGYLFPKGNIHENGQHKQETDKI